MTKTKPTLGQGRVGVQARKNGRGKAMTTSVQVSERTLQLLNKLKQEEGLRSHDQLIRKLIDQSLQVPRSMFGVDRHRKVQLTVREHEEITKDAH